MSPALVTPEGTSDDVVVVRSDTSWPVPPSLYQQALALEKKLHAIYRGKR